MHRKIMDDAKLRYLKSKIERAKGLRIQVSIQELSALILRLEKKEKANA